MEIKHQEKKLGLDDSCCALVFDKAFDALVNSKFTPKFKLLEDSMHKDLISCIKANYTEILKATQVKICEYNQYFTVDFINVQVMADALVSSNYNWLLDIC